MPVPDQAANAGTFATLVFGGSECVAQRSHETSTPEWAVSHAVAGLRVAAVPIGGSGAWSRFLLAAWPLIAAGAVEVRWLGTDGHVSCFVLLRSTASSAQLAEQEVGIRLGALERLATLHLPGWAFAPLTAKELQIAVQPFDVIEGGDYLRREVSVELRDSELVDVPVSHGADPFQLQLIVDALASAQAPTLLSLAAAPTEIDEVAEDVLMSELARVELAAIGMPVLGDQPPLTDEDTPISQVRFAAELLRRRVRSPEMIGFLRVSLASAGPLELHVIAAVQEAASSHAASMRWVPAAEPAERQTFVANLRSLGFKPWGLQAQEQPGHETVNDCYLASIEEIVGVLRVPSPSPYSALQVEMIDPAPRAVPAALPASGRMLGCSVVDPSRRVALAETERTRHTYVVGQTGTGKSTLLMNLILQDINAGQGCCVVDPHGDLVDALLERYPKSRAEDLVLFDPSNLERVIGLNPLQAQTSVEQDFLIQGLLGMLYRIYDPGHTGIIGPRFEHWFRNAALTVMAGPEGGTLLDIPRVFTDDAFLASKLAHVDDPVVRSFWIDELGQTSDYHKSEMLGWFVAKFGAFNTNAAMRGILSQRESTIDIKEIMDSGKVLLVKLPRGVLGETNAMWLGMILISRIQMITLGRASVAPSERMLFNLYVDEFQNFAYTDFDALIAEARKYGVSLTLAHQHVAQLTDSIRSAVFGNIATWLLFRTGLHDAELLEDDVDGYSARDLARLPNRRCIVRTAVDGQPVAPFDVTTMGPDTYQPDAEIATALSKLSGLKYGRAAGIVEMEYRASWARPNKAGVEPVSGRAVQDADAETIKEPQVDADVLEAAWRDALGGDNLEWLVKAAHDHSLALTEARRRDEGAAVLDATLNAVGPAADRMSVRRRVAGAAARLHRTHEPGLAALALAKLVFSEGFDADGWQYVLGIAGGIAQDGPFADAFRHVTELYERGEQPTWAELEADDAFA